VSRVRENRMHGSMGGAGDGADAAMATGSGHPWETAGGRAGPTAVHLPPRQLPTRHHTIAPSLDVDPSLLIR